mmetsp:Transcript_5074/g.14088  ORF Transcript_5074/g.14088 Transcript_5074/m.14088 type:complete len:792 (-) Transcript_5074:285-2660(-)
MHRSDATGAGCVKASGVIGTSVKHNKVIPQDSVLGTEYLTKSFVGGGEMGSTRYPDLGKPRRLCIPRWGDDSLSTPFILGPTCRPCATTRILKKPTGRSSSLEMRPAGRSCSLEVIRDSRAVLTSACVPRRRSKPRADLRSEGNTPWAPRAQSPKCADAFLSRSLAELPKRPTENTTSNRLFAFSQRSARDATPNKKRLYQPRKCPFPDAASTNQLLAQFPKGLLGDVTPKAPFLVQPSKRPSRDATPQSKLAAPPSKRPSGDSSTMDGKFFARVLRTPVAGGACDMTTERSLATSRSFTQLRQSSLAGTAKRSQSEAALGLPEKTARAHSSKESPVWLKVTVPDGAEAGGLVFIPGFEGTKLRALVPSGMVAGDTFSVQVSNGSVLQPQKVKLPAHAKAGDVVRIRGFDGVLRKTQVPEAAISAGSFVSMVPICQGLRSAPMGDLLSESSLEPWLKAARGFNMNTDFAVQDLDLVEKFDFKGLVSAMKSSSAGKTTIQMLGDKLLLSQVLDNLRVPQMPVLLDVRDPSEVSTRVADFVDRHLLGRTRHVILKPTHLSNADGVKSFGPTCAKRRDSAVQAIVAHIREYLAKHASENESEALQSLRPGFLAQPMYESELWGPGSPVELRVTSLWGRARTAVWWWGDTMPRRNVWITRNEENPSKWDACHEHEAGDAIFDDALEMFMRHMQDMVSLTERLATSFGAPFLRADFFLGSSEFGVCLNEVAYGSGIEYRRQQGDKIVDDAAVLAQILREGFEACTTVSNREIFLNSLGAYGESYDNLVVRAASGPP